MAGRPRLRPVGAVVPAALASRKDAPSLTVSPSDQPDVQVFVVWYYEPRYEEVVNLTQDKLQPNAMPALYKRLREAGFSKKYVTGVVLPEWWNDEIARSQAGYEHAIGLISRNLGLDPSSLREPDGEITCIEAGPRRFKKRLRDSENDLTLAECIATRAAALVAHAAAIPYAGDVPTAGILRRDILEQHQSCVDLTTVLDYCWKSGIPVVHISAFPPGAKKMQGLAVKIGGRPVIVLADNHSSPAWLLFLIAHELGHIALGHLKHDVPRIDEDINRSGDNSEEATANTYAIELLNGRPDASYKSSTRITAQNLATTAKSIETNRQIDPGVIALNYGRTTGYWPVAMAALKLIEPDRDATATVREYMLRNLDWERIPEESGQYLQRLMGGPTPRDLPQGQ